MVTEDELAMIMKLRANGLNHQEIADKLQIPRSTIAYQLSKLKESALIETPLKIIEAQGFEANQTTVSFTPHDFENNRTSLTLYVSGNDVFEIKEGLIHKTTMGKRHRDLKGKDYGELASIIKADPNWFQIPNLQQLIDDFNRTYGNPFELRNYPVNVRNRSGGVNIFLHHSFAEEWRHFYQNKFSHVYNELFPKNIPRDTVSLIKYFVGKPSPYNNYITEKSTELAELRKTVKLSSNGATVPQLVIAWFELNGIAERDVSFCMDSNVKNSKGLKMLRTAGCATTQQLDELAKTPYSQWNDYQLAIKYHRILYPHQPQPTHYRNQRQQPPQSPKFITAIQFNKIVQEGWSEQEMAKAIQLGFNPLSNTKEVYEQMPNRLKRIGLKMDKATVEWASTVDLSAYEGFSSPRAAVLFGIIQMSATNTLRLDSLLSTYNSAAEPGANIANVKQLHDQVLSKPPFIDICMSDPVSGMVEKTSGDSYVPKPQVVVVEKIVEVTPSVNPLLPISNYNHLMTSPEALESKLRDAINRQDLADSNTRAWIRFESHSKSILRKNGIEIPKDEKRFNVKLVDHITSFLSLSEPQCKLLHQSRMIRNDENHPDEDPSGIILKLNHVKSLLEITERIV